MGNLKASHSEIESKEIVHFLLRECGQHDQEAVNPSDLLDYLQLKYISFNFGDGLPSQLKAQGAWPRAVISFADRLIGVDKTLSHHRRRFSVLHEVAHYVLPTHHHSIYLCDMNPWTKLTFEKEANEFAADLLFKGSFFSIDASKMPISAATIVALADKYDVSYEATARHLVEKSLHPAMLVVFKRSDEVSQLNPDSDPIWNVRYCVASTVFKNRFFAQLTGPPPSDVATELRSEARSIQDSVARRIVVTKANRDDPSPFHAEFFRNRYNIFCILTPDNAHTVR